MKPQGLISLEDLGKVSQQTLLDWYKEYVNPGIARFLSFLGTDRLRIEKAEGICLFTDDDRCVLDFSGGLGVLNHGHNHPRILEVRRRFAEQKRMETCKATVSPYQAVLGHNLAKIFPGDLNYSFFCNSGAEANEGALKIALLYHKNKRRRVIHTDQCYHGKTIATMSVSGRESGAYRELFPGLGLPGSIEVPFGDVHAIRQILEGPGEHNNDIAAIILEAIKGDLVIIPPKGYLEEVADLCRKHDVLLIVDEVFTGFGRTGRMFAFEYTDVLPDIVTFSKSFGGGKASIAGYIVRTPIFKKTYGPMSRCVVHTTTFGGLGEECATAIEALHILYDEGLIENARNRGQQLSGRLQRIAEKYPQYIREVRSVGLIAIVEMQPMPHSISRRFHMDLPFLNEAALGLLPALVVAELLRAHDILIFTGGREDNLLINPSLVVTEEQVDVFADALEAVLERGLLKLAASAATGYFR